MKSLGPDKVVHGFNPRRQRQADLSSRAAWNRASEVKNSLGPSMVIHIFSLGCTLLLEAHIRTAEEGTLTPLPLLALRC